MSKTKTWKRILSLCLSLVMVLILTACGGGSSEEEDDGSTKLNATTDDTVVDMGGYEFTIASHFLVDNPDPSEITVAEAIFEEVRHQVEEDYNCKITILPIQNTVESVRTKILAGDKIADVIDVTGIYVVPMARAGYIIPLESVEGLNLSDSRWVQGYTEFSEFNGQHYGVNFMRPAEARICLVYNRELLKNYGITEDPQDLVTSNTWTYDKFREMCKTVTRDTNGDGQNDTIGLFAGLREEFGTSMIAANGGSLVTSADGVAKESFNDAKVLTAMNCVYDMINADKTVVWSSGNSENVTDTEAISRFVSGRYGFYLCETWTINQLLKPVAGDLDYGILPLPMGPDATDYVSPSENAREFCITSTNKDVDKTVTILNALARYTEEYGEDENWWHYDVEMDYFQEGDQKSVDIYTMLIDKATYDLGVGVTDLWKNFQEQVVWDACFLNKGTPASRIEAITGKYQSAIDAIYN